LPYYNPRPRYPLPNILRTNKQTKKQTVNDISPTCLLACGDNKALNSQWHMHAVLISVLWSWAGTMLKPWLHVKYNYFEIISVFYFTRNQHR